MITEPVTAADTGLSCWGRTVIRTGGLGALFAATAYGLSWLLVPLGLYDGPPDPVVTALAIPAGAAVGLAHHAAEHHWHVTVPSAPLADLPDLSPAELGYCTTPGCGHVVWRVHRDHCLGLTAAGEPCPCRRPDPEYVPPRTAAGRALRTLADRLVRDPDVWHADRTTRHPAVPADSPDAPGPALEEGEHGDRTRQPR